jgi:cytochrome c-type biogenesis protein
MPEWPFIAGALWLGILTSISPCPLATNIAAVAFLARRGDQRAAVAWSSLAYIAGRMAAYTLLAILLAAGIFSAPAVAEFLRTKMEGLIGPGLIVVGMLVAGWLPVKLPGFGGINSLGTRLAERGFVGEFLMGAVFALAFCPVSAALFFGGLLPTVVQTGSTVTLPVTYGIGTALPVVVAVGLLACGFGMAAERLRRLQNFGARLQQGTAWVLIAVGIWLTIRGMVA